HKDTASTSAFGYADLLAGGAACELPKAGRGDGTLSRRLPRNIASHPNFQVAPENVSPSQLGAATWPTATRSRLAPEWGRRPRCLAASNAARDEPRRTSRGLQRGAAAG